MSLAKSQQKIKGLIMKNKSANYGKIAVIAIALAVAATCTVSGTLAAFSATYTWNSDSASVGEIDYRDTVYSFALFNNESITPGDSGSAVLNGADFGENTVQWSFTSHNEQVVPVVFYVLGDDGLPDETSFYSEYSFDGLKEYYVLCAEGSVVGLSAVSSDPAVMAKSLGIGKTVCWAWFEDFFTNIEATEKAEGLAVDEYAEYCTKICASEYAFDTGLSDILESAYVHAFVTGTNGDDLKVKSFDMNATKSVENGLILIGGETCYVYGYGMFSRPVTSFDLLKDSAAWLLVPETDGDSSAFENALAEIGVRYEKGELYSLGEVVVEATDAIRDENGNRRLYKIYPNLTDGERARISVTISATVTA